MRICFFYRLEGGKTSYKYIKSFIRHWKKIKAKFISGPFTNMIFEILERQKNKLKISVGNIVTTISNKKNYLYQPIWSKIKIMYLKT